MDSKLDSLSLPVLRPSIHAPEAELGGQSDPTYRVGCLVDRYFEWAGTFESSMFFTPCAWNDFAYSFDDEEDASPSQPGPLIHTLRLMETARGDDQEGVVLLWKQIDGQGRVFNDRPGVTYTWQ
jgi:hypothetical protein